MAKETPFDTALRDAHAWLATAHYASMGTLETELQHLRSENVKLRMRLSELSTPTDVTPTEQQLELTSISKGASSTCELVGSSNSSEYAAPTVVEVKVTEGSLVVTTSSEEQRPAACLHGHAHRPEGQNVQLECGDGERTNLQPTEIIQNAVPEDHVPEGQSPSEHECGDLREHRGSSGSEVMSEGARPGTEDSALHPPRQPPMSGAPQSDAAVVQTNEKQEISQHTGASHPDAPLHTSPCSMDIPEARAEEPTEQPTVEGSEATSEITAKHTSADLPSDGSLSATNSIANTPEEVDKALQAVLAYYGWQHLDVHGLDGGVWSICGTPLAITCSSSLTGSSIANGPPFLLLAYEEASGAWEALDVVIRKRRLHKVVRTAPIATGTLEYFRDQPLLGSAEPLYHAPAPRCRQAPLSLADLASLPVGPACMDAVHHQVVGVQAPSHGSTAVSGTVRHSLATASTSRGYNQYDTMLRVLVHPQRYHHA